MGSWSHRCSGHWHSSRPHNWTVVGASTAYAALSDVSDSTYAKSPASKHRLQLTFPQNPTNLPTGGIVTSVTFFVRCARIGSTPRPLTVQISAQDHPSRYISRTVFPSTTISNMEVGTYKRDCRGFSWDIHRINKLFVSLMAPDSVADTIRVYEVYAQVNYKVMPTVTVDAPSGTVETASPTIAWTYTHSEGDAQLKSLVKLFTATDAAKTEFDPDKSPPVYSTETQGDTESLVLPVSINPDSYFAYVKVWSVHNAVSVWGSRQFTVTSPSPAPPGDDNAGVAGTPGVGVISVVPNSYESSSKLTLRDASNLLSVNQADFEQDSDPLGFHTTTNATVAQKISVFYEGGGDSSMEIKSVASGNMDATAQYFELAAGVPVTLRAQLKAAASARSCKIGLYCYSEAFAQVGSVIESTLVSDSTSTWTELTATGDTPAGTVYGAFKISVNSTGGASEIHYADHVGVMYGTNSAWSHGGHSSRNILAASLTNGQDPAGSITWASGNAATTVSRPTAVGTGHGGGKMNRMTYAGVSPTVGFRATSTVFTSPTGGTDYTLNKPAGLADNDLMIAFVSATESGTITPPTGWTAVNTSSIDDGSTDTALWILKRTGLAADPATWTDGSLTTTASRRRAVVVAYSGAATADQQFIAQAVNTDSSGSLVHTSGSVNNTDANAWRVAAFACSDEHSGATSIANIQPPAAQYSISYVGTSSWTSQSDGTSFTLYRPTGTATSDLYIATVAANANVTMTVPSGWTLVRRTVIANDPGTVTHFVLKKTDNGTEPTSWTGSFSATVSNKVAGVTCYRGADTAANQFIAESSVTKITSSSITTPSITNTDSRAWRICSFAFNSGFGESVTSTEIKERFDVATDRSGYYDITAAMYDSNGTVSTGSHSRTGTLTDSMYAGVGWIGLIKPLPSPPAPPANETERTDGVTGSSLPWLQMAVYDSNATVAIGSSSVTAQFTSSDGGVLDSSASWVGLVKPATDSGGVVAAKTSASIDISSLDPEVLDLCDNKITAVGSFVGNAGGVPVFTVGFYRANQLISTGNANGAPFGTGTFSKASATFDLPEGTTGIQLTVSAPGRIISDTVDFIRMGVNLGSDATWRQGTARDFHPVWSVPQLQYADDAGSGYGEWKMLPGQSSYRPVYDGLSGQVKYFDHTVTPLVKRKYRVQTKTFGLNGDVAASGYGPSSEEVALEAIYWWLKDLSDLSLNLVIDVKAKPLSVGTTNTATVFQPLGEDYPVVLSEGYKSDAIEISVFIRRENFARLVSMLKSRRTLFLQSNIDNAWWVRPVGDIQADTLVTGKMHVDPIREVKLTFVQVAPEA